MTMEKALKRLPLTQVQPQGWLRTQLQNQMNGLSGILYDIWDSVGSYSGWLGGTGDGWERVPYYLDGLLPLSYYLQDEKHWEICMKFINWTLQSQRADGYFGPISSGATYAKYDRWSRFVMMKVLIQYYEITADERVLPFLKNFMTYFANSIEADPPKEWTKARVPDFLYCVKWLYEHTGDETLLEIAKKADASSFDWNEFLEELPFPYPAKYYINWKALFEMSPHNFDVLAPYHATHIVNVTMGFKHPAMSYYFTGDDRYRTIAKKGIARVIDRHGVVSGCINGDEHLAGNNPNQGSELCSVVEYMFSLQSLIEVFGDPEYADLLERLAYNALPATITEDFMAHQYLQQANQVLVTDAERPWFNNTSDSTVYGLEPHFGCCTANMHQGWPRFVQSLWYQEAEDILVSMAFAPSTVKTTADGQPVSVKLDTEYPFRDTLRYTFEEAPAQTFTLKIRVPGWCTAPKVTCEGAKVEVNGHMMTVTKKFEAGETVLVTLPMEVSYSKWYHQSVAVERGPLVYGLDMKERWEVIKEVAGVKDYEVYPESDWNYALSTSNAVSVKEQPVSAHPFSKDCPPVRLSVMAKKVPEWQMDGNNAGDVPVEVHLENEAETEISLIPFGCTKLRVSQFPYY